VSTEVPEVMRCDLLCILEAVEGWRDGDLEARRTCGAYDVIQLLPMM